MRSGRTVSSVIRMTLGRSVAAAASAGDKSKRQRMMARRINEKGACIVADSFFGTKTGGRRGCAAWRWYLSSFLFLGQDSERIYTYRLDTVQREEIPMPNDLATLETQRSKLLGEFPGLADLRPASLHA